VKFQYRVSLTRHGRSPYGVCHLLAAGKWQPTLRICGCVRRVMLVMRVDVDPTARSVRLQPGSARPAFCDSCFQPYGAICVMNADGQLQQEVG
jgi:hypothetical protein